MVTDYAGWRKRLAKANDAAFWPITAIDEMLTEGRAQFWCDGRGAMVTKVVNYPGGAVAVEAVAAAGNLEALNGPIAQNCEEWARSIGATHLHIAGRPGWERALPKDWRKYQVIMLKELTDGR